MSILQEVINERQGDIPLDKKIYNLILSEILNNNLKKGSRLTEKNICEKYKISRTPTREAIKKLESNGIIEHIPNRGAIIRGISYYEIKDLLILRQYAEEQATYFAIERIDKKLQKEMDDLFNHMKFYTKTGDIRNMIDINIAFHRIIYRATNNLMLENTLINYQKYVEYSLPSNYFKPNYLENVLQEHRLIYNAFKKKNPEDGLKAMRRHMNHSIRRRNKGQI